jgi:hypothetical protein
MKAHSFSRRLPFGGLLAQLFIEICVRALHKTALSELLWKLRGTTLCEEAAHLSWACYNDLRHVV